jgi:hypothetical protein
MMNAFQLSYVVFAGGLINRLNEKQSGWHQPPLGG